MSDGAMLSFDERLRRHDELVPQPKVAKMLGVTSQTVRHMVLRGELTPVGKDGRSPLYFKEEVNRLVGYDPAGLGPSKSYVNWLK